MLCMKCANEPCQCGTEKQGPKGQIFDPSFGNTGVWKAMPPKVVSQGPRLGLEPFNNSPKQPKLESK